MQTTARGVLGMPLSRGRRAAHREASPLDQLERIEEALGCYRHLANVRELVYGQPSATVTLATAAKAIGVSQCHLARLFQEKVGTSFHYWMTLRRSHTAMMLMRERPVTASEAARLSGFASYRSFARAFKEVVGLSPSIYRRQAQQARRGGFAKN